MSLSDFLLQIVPGALRSLSDFLLQTVPGVLILCIITNVVWNLLVRAAERLRHATNESRRYARKAYLVWLVRKKSVPDLVAFVGYELAILVMSSLMLLLSALAGLWAERNSVPIWLQVIFMYGAGAVVVTHWVRLFALHQAFRADMRGELVSNRVIMTDDVFPFPRRPWWRLWRRAPRPPPA